MMSLEHIRTLSRRAARQSAADGVYPTTVEQDDIDVARAAVNAGQDPELRIPFIGARRPRGYRPTKSLFFVDSSGFGRPGEAALTLKEFVNKLQPDHAYAVVEAGQFQVYVQEYTVNKRKE